MGGGWPSSLGFSLHVLLMLTCHSYTFTTADPTPSAPSRRSTACDELVRINSRAAADPTVSEFRASPDSKLADSCRDPAVLHALLATQPFVVLDEYLPRPNATSVRKLLQMCGKPGEGGDLRMFGCDHSLDQCRDFLDDSLLMGCRDVPYEQNSNRRRLATRCVHVLASVHSISAAL